MARPDLNDILELLTRSRPDDFNILSFSLAKVMKEAANHHAAVVRSVIKNEIATGK